MWRIRKLAITECVNGNAENTHGTVPTSQLCDIAMKFKLVEGMNEVSEM